MKILIPNTETHHLNIPPNTLVKAFLPEATDTQPLVTMTTPPAPRHCHTFIIWHIENFIHRFWNIHFVLLSDGLGTKKKKLLQYEWTWHFYGDDFFLSELIDWYPMGLQGRGPRILYTQHALSLEQHVGGGGGGVLRNAPQKSTRWKSSRDIADDRLWSPIRLFQRKRRKHCCACPCQKNRISHPTPGHGRRWPRITARNLSLSFSPSLLLPLCSSLRVHFMDRI